MARYLNEKETFVTHTDDQGKTHVVASLGTYAEWKELDLDPTKKPLTKRTVEWENEEIFDWHDKKLDLTDQNDIIWSVYAKMREYFQSCNKYDH